MSIPRACLATSIVALLAAVAPAAASAADLRIDGSTIVFTAAPGEANQIDYGQNGDEPGQFAMADYSDSVTAHAPCTSSGDFLTCPAAGITAARFDLGDGNDNVAWSDGRSDTSVILPLIVSGGDGNDSLYGASLADTIDGGAGDDKVYGDAGDDTLTGADGSDAVVGGAGDDAVDGGAGADQLGGRDGNDTILGGAGIDSASGGPGDDRIDLHDGEADSSASPCDEGDDTITVDPNDAVAEHKEDGTVFVDASCEHIIGQPAPTPKDVFFPGRVNKRGVTRLTVDMYEAFPATIKVQLVLSRKWTRNLDYPRKVARARVGSGTVHFKPVRSSGRIKLTKRFAKAARGTFLPVTVRVSIEDLAGRTSKRDLNNILIHG